MGMEGFAARLRRAHRAFEDQLGEMVGEELRRMGVKPTGKDDPVTQQSVARWFAGTLPEHARMVALATVLGVDPGWLSYGSGGDEGQQGAHLNGNPGPIVGPTVNRVLPKEVSRLEDEKPARKGTPARRPRGRTAVAS
jgi:hypothetical protein